MNLRQTALSAGRWTATSAALAVALQLVQTMVLARILSPADFGLMAVVAAALAVLAVVADLGISRALIHFDHLTPEALSSLYWLNMLVALALAFALVLGAPMLAALYKAPALVPVLQAASLMFPIAAIGQQFRALAEKDFRFSALAGIEIASTLIGFVLALVVAFAGGGVFALVAGMLGTAATSSLLAWQRLSDGRRPIPRLRLREAGPYLRFGAYLMGENIASTLHRQADLFVGGFAAGPANMGNYALPRELSLRVATMINPIITRVGFPVMARVKHDREQLKAIYLRTLRMTASVNFPIYVALAVFSDEVVALLYGAQWRDAGMYLRILALWGLVRSVSNPVGSLLYAVGRARLALCWNISLLVLVPPLYWLAAELGGLPGLAWGMLAIQLVVMFPAWLFLVRPSCGAGLIEYLEQTAVPLGLALAAGAAGYLAGNVAEPGFPRLAVGSAVGCCAYLAMSLRFNRSWSEAVFQLLRLR